MYYDLRLNEDSQMRVIPEQIDFPGPIVIIGFGSIGKGALPLILRHIGIAPRNAAPPCGVGPHDPRETHGLFVFVSGRIAGPDGRRSSNAQPEEDAAAQPTAT